ncbi:hypothetical protein SAMN05421772_1179 [Paracoccus saliphilus]|uniref:Uncharacterized protein n=1 Tax=Paracoccus saliphilus TaxID=405559 RepID=A0AA46A761_9RHOB|nr:hypothetical protein SAMN05421772_1179 [Paracoccus saliphilus]
MPNLTRPIAWLIEHDLHSMLAAAERYEVGPYCLVNSLI